MKSHSRVLFILHMPPPVHGSGMMGKYIHDSEFINSVLSTRYVNLSTSKSIKEIGGGSIKKFFRYIKIIIRVMYTLITFRPKLCYFTIAVNPPAFYKDFFLIMLIKFFSKAKIVYHFHNKGIKENKKNHLKRLYHLAFSNTNAIILSEKLYEDISDFFSRDKIFVVPNGIQYQNFYKSEVKDNFIILFLSNLIKTKGVIELLEACKILSDKNVKFKCWFVGGEGDISAIDFENIKMNLNLKDNVEFLGKRYGSDKEKIFLSSSLFVFPTFYKNETFGIVNLEAMNAGIPIISTDEGAISDLIENGYNGFLIEKQNSEILAEKIYYLYCNKDIAHQMGLNGRKKLLAEFTIEKFEKKLLNCLQNIIED
ncbi:glycosyltransferase family 4 protein [Zunongwangia sp.]|uniref:glycosyltransferase family 4 protein n=1 Tax=Zunongwangia sp. TaxID=1965325 RepID=UPI003AA8390F